MIEIMVVSVLKIVGHLEPSFYGKVGSGSSSNDFGNSNVPENY